MVDDSEDWPSFPRSLLEAPAEVWGRLPRGKGWGKRCRDDAARDDAEQAASASLLADLEEAFADARSQEERAKALQTMRIFLGVRRVRLIEDMILLSLSLGAHGAEMDEDDSAVESNALQTVSAKRADVNDDLEGSGPDGLASTRARLRHARQRLRLLLPTRPNSPGGGTFDGGDAALAPFEAPGDDRVVLNEGGDAYEALQAAAEVSMAKFFSCWAEQCGALVVPLGGGTEDRAADAADANGGKNGGHPQKDNREIQSARDIERDTLLVNGVLVVGSEGYATVIGRMKRELGRLAEPVVGQDENTQRTTQDTAADPGQLPPSKHLQSPLRPRRQLENFSKLVLKAANRTESGGLSFDAIHRIMALCPSACDGSVLVVPDSSGAEPLGVSVTAEGFVEKDPTRSLPLDRGGIPELQEGLTAFGICARVKAVTVYNLYSADMETVYRRLRATFRNTLRLPLSPVSSSTCESFGDVGYRGEDGEITIEVLDGPKQIQQ